MLVSLNYEMTIACKWSYKRNITFH